MIENDTIISDKMKDAFWNVVVECLIQFHDFTRADAQERSRKLRKGLGRSPSGVSSDIFYHSEPYNVACDIAGKQRDITADFEQYHKILDENHW